MNKVDRCAVSQKLMPAQLACTRNITLDKHGRAEYAKFFCHVYVIEIIVTLLFALTLFKGISFTYKLRQFRPGPSVNWRKAKNTLCAILRVYWTVNLTERTVS